MQIQIHSAIVALLLLSLASASPNYILAQNLSIGTRVRSMTFLSDSTLVTGEQSGEVTFFEFDGSQFNEAAKFNQLSFSYALSGSEEDPRQIVCSDYPPDFFRYEHSEG